jgi:long-chain acyl-CoA synthetase
VLRPIRGLLGLGEAGSVFSAAAPLPPDVAAFFAGLGMKILDIYGMTETTGAFTADTPVEFKLGTVGRPIAGIEVRIADDGEIQVRGPLYTPGYLSQPSLTDALVTADGWLRTGDIGTIDADGFVSVTDRKKELIITAGSFEALTTDPQVLAEVAAGVAAANDRLARVQQVKRWRLLPVEWTAETEELTPTLKLKRRVVHAKYASVIDFLYAG